MFLIVISTHEDTTFLKDKSNERVFYLKLSSNFLYWRLAIISYTYSVYLFFWSSYSKGSSH